MCLGSPRSFLHSCEDDTEVLINRVLLQLVGPAAEVLGKFLDAAVAVGEEAETEGNVTPLPLSPGGPETEAQLLDLDK